VSVIASRRDFYRKLWQARTEWRSMDGFTDLLDCIADDRGLFFLSVCNKAVVPRWLYASYWWRHRVVLRTRISTLGNACTDTVCIPNLAYSHRHRISICIVAREFVSVLLRSMAGKQCIPASQ
jgi:hypothetical protein